MKFISKISLKAITLQERM